MSRKANQSMPLTSDAVEPKAGSAAVPVWLVVLLFLLLYGGMVFFDRNGGWFNQQVYAPYHSVAELTSYQLSTSGPDIDQGKVVYESICGLCHNNDGMGKPNQAPPFVGSEWVLGSPNRMIRIPLFGLSGPLKVKGQDWNLAMPNMGAALPDDDLAAVLTYIRQSWGNKASAITPEQVKAVKAEVGSRTLPWSATELNAIP
ncbi:MAG: cytochrome c [Verrucomicrobiota bacterium]